MRAHVDHQTGTRRELIDKIAEETGTEDSTNRVKRLSAAQVHAIYEKLTGNKKQVAKGRAWHLQKIVENTNVTVRKSLRRNNVQTPTNALQNWLQALQQQS